MAPNILDHNMLRIKTRNLTDGYFRTKLSGQGDVDCSGYNKLNTSPKLSNLTEERTSLNVKLSHGDVISDHDVNSDADDAAFLDDDVITDDDVIREPKLVRRHFTSSQSDIENCGANLEETDCYRTSSRVSISDHYHRPRQAGLGFRADI